MADANLKYRDDDRIRFNAQETFVNAVSPRVNVSTITGGHRVSVVDIDGTETFDVMNGDKGDKGDPGSVIAQTMTLSEVDEAVRAALQ